MFNHIGILCEVGFSTLISMKTNCRDRLCTDHDMRLCLTCFKSRIDLWVTCRPIHQIDSVKSVKIGCYTNCSCNVIIFVNCFPEFNFTVWNVPISKRCLAMAYLEFRPWFVFIRQSLVLDASFYSVGPEMAKIFPSGSRAKEVWEPLE